VMMTVRPLNSIRRRRRASSRATAIAPAAIAALHKFRFTLMADMECKPPATAR
jgi:hypothetical protein